MISEALQGTIVGGVIGLFSSIVSTFIISWIRRPIISINENTTEVQMNYKEVGSDQYVTMEDEKPQLTPQINFVATRIKIENKGMTAAKNCKASLITEKNENRVAWMLPNDDFTVTINAHDSEYVDLCAISEFFNTQGHRIRIITTERGYGESQHHRSSLPPGKIEAELKISAENAKGRSKKLWITDVPNMQFKIVHFKEV